MVNWDYLDILLTHISEIVKKSYHWTEFIVVLCNNKHLLHELDINEEMFKELIFTIIIIFLTYFHGVVLGSSEGNYLFPECKYWMSMHLYEYYMGLFYFL